MTYAERAEEGARNAMGRAGEIASSTAEKLEASMDSQRQKTADALNEAADGVDRQADRLPNPLDEYADAVKNALGSTADYVRHNNAREMADDAGTLVSDHPVASLLILGAAIGGGLILASVIGGEHESSASSEHRAHSASSTPWGPRTAAVVAQFRDALFGLAVAKAVQSVDELFPGFKEHYERA